MSKDLIIGSCFVVVGVVLLLAKALGLSVSFPVLAALCLFISGSILSMVYIVSGRKSNGVLLPISVCFITSITLFFNLILPAQLRLNGAFWVLTSFAYPASVAVGLFLIWFNGGKNTVIMALAIFFGFISLVVLCASSFAVIVFRVLQSMDEANTAPFLVLSLLLLTLGMVVLAAPFVTAKRKEPKSDQGAFET